MLCLTVQGPGLMNEEKRVNCNEVVEPIQVKGSVWLDIAVELRIQYCRNV